MPFKKKSAEKDLIDQVLIVSPSGMGSDRGW